MCVTIWAAYAYFIAEKNEEQLSRQRIELKISEKVYAEAQEHYKISLKERDSLRKEIRQQKSVVNIFRKRLAKKEREDAQWRLGREDRQREKREAREERERAERMAREEKEQAERVAREEKEQAERMAREEKEQAEREMRELEREKRDIENKVSWAREALYRVQSPPQDNDRPANDYGLIDKVNAMWSQTVRDIISSSIKGDRKKVNASVKRLRALARRADQFLKGIAYTSEVEKVSQLSSELWQLNKRLKEIKEIEAQLKEMKKKSR